MKKILFSLCILIILSCCSCGFFGEQSYVCDVERVESVQIIRLEKYIKDEYRYEYTVVSCITDIEAFVSRLNEVEHSVNWGEPTQFYLQDIVIRIEYSDGDYDLLHSDAQWFNRSGRNNSGYFFFDDEQFNSLISDYMDE